MDILIPTKETQPGIEKDAELLRTDRKAGHILIDGIEVAMTLQCCHCGSHWVHYRSHLVINSNGPKRTRGFCTKCMQVTCGRKECDPCIPFEQKLDMYESKQLAVLR